MTATDPRSEARRLFRECWGYDPGRHNSNLARRYCKATKTDGGRCFSKARAGLNTCGKHKDQEPLV